MTMDRHAVSIRGGAFETEVLESGQGQPLLFLHGAMGLASGDPFLEGLAGRHHVIAPAHPGYGSSTGDEHLVDFHDLLYYYLDFLDEMGLTGVPLVGHSLGGMIAAELAALQPSRFTRLVLIAPTGLWHADYPVMDFFVASPAEVSTALWADPASPMAQAAARAPESDEERIAAALERAKSMRTAAKYLWPIPNRGLAKRIHRVTMPTLIVWGNQDGLVPVRYAEDFQSLIPGSEVVRVEGGAHLVQIEKTAEVLSAVERFLGHP